MLQVCVVFNVKLIYSRNNGAAAVALTTTKIDAFQPKCVELNLTNIGNNMFGLSFGLKVCSQINIFNIRQNANHMTKND